MGRTRSSRRVDIGAPTPRPTALLCLSDRLAEGALRAAARLGLGVPEDLSVAGFDDAPPAAGLGLTTMRQPNRRKGQLAASALLHLLDGSAADAVHTLPTELITRSTTGPPSILEPQPRRLPRATQRGRAQYQIDSALTLIWRCVRGLKFWRGGNELAVPLYGCPDCGWATTASLHNAVAAHGVVAPECAGTVEVVAEWTVPTGNQARTAARGEGRDHPFFPSGDAAA